MKYLFNSTMRLYYYFYPKDPELDWSVIGYLSAALSFLTFAILNFFSIQKGFNIILAGIIYVVYGFAINLSIPKDQRKVDMKASPFPSIIFLLISILIFALSVN